jgi:hypothetical protein
MARHRPSKKSREDNSNPSGQRADASNPMRAQSDVVVARPRLKKKRGGRERNPRGSVDEPVLEPGDARPGEITK